MASADVRGGGRLRDEPKKCLHRGITMRGFVLVCTCIKQLLDEVEHDIMNYQNRGLCYLPKPKAEADNTDTRF